jgi:hypothetical protein
MLDLLILIFMMSTAYVAGITVYIKHDDIKKSVLAFLVIQLTFVYCSFYI